MTSSGAMIDQIYSAFNRRDVDAVLAHMSEDVSWPKASEGGRARGKDEIRAYWSRQWKELDPYVYPVEVTDRDAGKIAVRVHQVVKSVGGEVLSDSEVMHVYSIVGGRIERMDIEASGPHTSTAFSPGER